MNDTPTKNASTATNIRKPTDLYYVPGRWYSVTICPNDQLEKSPNRWERLCNRIHECVIGTFTGLAAYRYNVEISEPHDTIKASAICRIHAHGRFMLFNNESVLQFLLFGLRNVCQLGITEIDTIEDLYVWDTYCEKQRAITRFETVNELDAIPPKKKTLLKAYDQPKNVNKVFWEPPKPTPSYTKLKYSSSSDDLE